MSVWLKAAICAGLLWGGTWVSAGDPSLPPAQAAAVGPAVPHQRETVHAAAPSGDAALWSRLFRVLSLRDYNTRVVLLGTTLLGGTGGVVGAFLLLRKRALVGDVVGHAALPGIAVGFLLMEAAVPGSGKWLPGLLAGAFVFGLAGAVGVMLIHRFSRVKPDAAMAIVLSVFYGLGAALFSVVQRVPSGNAAGLKGFLNGKTASLVADDVWLFAATGACVLGLTVLLFKELTLLCFDETYAAAQGWPVTALDAALTGLIVAVTVVGMQSVGLILVVATLILPATAARFWTDDLRRMTVVSGMLGGLSAFLGTVVSALFPRVAAGATIVLAGSVLFVVSLCFGRRRGIVLRGWEQWQMQREIGRLDLLRSAYELIEQSVGRPVAVANELWRRTFHLRDLVPMRAWSAGRVRRIAARLEREGLIAACGGDGWTFTGGGAAESWRIVRNHRLWEMYLMQYADVAASHVDRSADRIEHVLDPQTLAELERQLAEQSPRMPRSSHDVGCDVSSERDV